MVRLFYLVSFCVLGLAAVLSVVWPPFAWSFLLLGPIFLLGVHDTLQKEHAVLRNFPIIGHLRYLMEMIRPEVTQYFIETDTEGRPFDRVRRATSYQRAKSVRDTVPFGTQRDVYEPGYELIHHSLAAKAPPEELPRVQIGGPDCAKPYSASVFNVSAMSFGSLSNAAILALNGGARLGGFYHNTGEGGVSPYHLEPGGDLVWQVGTGYFGCRDERGRFDPERFRECALREQVKMVEIKLSQGAKPGHGGILPGVKNTSEIAAIRGVQPGVDVISPPSHSTFDSPTGLCEFVGRLRELSGGKPVGLKLCLGDGSEFLSVCEAMRVTGIKPDFVTVDGGEGGTGAAPPEFSDSVGTPLSEALVFVHNALNGFGLREDIRIVASGKILTGFDILARIAVGADLCNAARSFMFSLGCIQALRCNSNVCPTGVATQNPRLVRGLVVEDKAERVASFHDETAHAFMELLGATGLDHPSQLRPRDVRQRVSESEIVSYEDIYPYIQPGELLEEPYPLYWNRLMKRVTLEPFAAARMADRPSGQGSHRAESRPRRFAR